MTTPKKTDDRARLRRTAEVNAPIAVVLVTLGVTVLVAGGSSLHTVGIVLAGAGGGMLLMLAALSIRVALTSRH